MRATRDFTVGPSREVVITKGTLRNEDPDDYGYFWTKTRGGSLFGRCRIGDGWEIVSSSEKELGGWLENTRELLLR